MAFIIGGNVLNASMSDTQDYLNVIQSGLKMHLDASTLQSYPGSGTDWYDISGNNNNGILINGPTFSTNAIRLDGVNDYIFLPNLGFAPPAFTSELWIKRHANNGYFFVIHNSDNPELRMQFINGNVVSYFFDDGGYGAIITSIASITLDVWYHVVMTGQSNDFRLYINGTLDTADTLGTYTGGINGNAGEHTLGTYNRPGTGYGGYANVSYGAYRFYNRVLSANEILHNFNVQKGRFGL